MSATYNINIVGNLTNNNGVLSGFSNTNYAIIPLPNVSIANPIEFNFRTKFEQSNDGSMLITLNDSNDIRIQLYDANCVIWKSTGSEICRTSTFAQALQTGDILQIKVILASGSISMQVFKDNTIIGSGNSSATFTTSGTINNVYIGRYYWSSSNIQYLHGEVDLNYCNIKANNIAVWEGVTHDELTVPKIGGNDISKIYLGSEEINKIYLGNEVVYEASSTPQYVEQIMPIPQMSSNSQGGFTVTANHYDRQWGSYEYTLFSPTSSGWYAGYTYSKPDTISITFPELHTISKIVLKQNNNSNSITHNGSVEITTDGTNYTTLTSFTMDTTLESLTTVDLNVSCLGYRLVFTDNASVDYPNNGVALLGVTTYELAPGGVA